VDEDLPGDVFIPDDIDALLVIDDLIAINIAESGIVLPSSFLESRMRGWMPIKILE
jgi:hypothetical protein